MDSGTGGAFYTRWPNNEPWYSSDPWRVVPRHNGMANCAFLDGHAKAETMDALIGPAQGSDPREILVDLDGQIPQNKPDGLE